MGNTFYKKGKLQGLYEQMAADRQPYLDKARLAVKYAIPSLLADEGKIYMADNPQTLISPHQAVVADGINNLAAKVTMTLMPPNQTFYKFSVDPVSLNQNANGQDKTEYEKAINKGLSLIEKMLLDYQEELADRVCVGEAIKHIYTTGNVLLVDTPKKGLKYYPLDRYCVKRTYTGELIKSITKETISFYDIPDSLKEQVLKKYGAEYSECNQEKIKDKNDFVLYTGCFRKDKHWEVTQEIEGFEVEEAKGVYPLETCPFIPLRYVRIDGESYGRGLIEEYFGDITTLDSLSQAVCDTSLAASKLIFLVEPSSTVNIQTLTETPNCGFVIGSINDIAPLQVNKYNDLQVAQVEIARLEQRLNRIFLMKSAIQRQAERVTAEEIRQMAQDLEETLGNHYSIMCNEFQRAYIKIKYFHLKKAKGKNLPDLFKDDSIKLTVTTGLEALGRNSDLTKLTTFLQIMQQLAPAIQSLGGKVDSIAQAVATSMNLNIEGYFYTEEEKQQMQQAAMEQELAAKAVPNLINQYGKQMEGEQPLNG